MTRKQLSIYAAVALIIGLAAGYYGMQRYQNSEIIRSEDPGLSQEDRQRLENELVEVNKRISELPDDADSAARYGVYMERAEIQKQLGRYNDAIKSLSVITEENNDNPVVWQKIAEVHVARRDYEEAAAAINRAIAFDPENPQYWERYIDLKSQNLNAPREEMEDIFADAFAKTDQNVAIMLAYAKYQESIGDPVVALNYMKFASQKQPENEDIKREIDRLQKVVAEKYQ